MADCNPTPRDPDSHLLALAGSLDLLRAAWERTEDALETLSDGDVDDEEMWDRLTAQADRIAREESEVEAEIMRLRPVTLAGMVVKAKVAAAALDDDGRAAVRALLGDVLAA